MAEIMKEGIVEVLDLWLDSRLKNVHTILPAKIESYSGHDKRKAQVKIQVRFRTVDGQILTIDPIDDVPVIFPSSGKFSLLFPLNKGDGCLVAFSEEGIGNFLKSTTEVDADSLARFQLSDAICIPGLWSFKNVPSSTSTIEIDDSGNVNINGSPDVNINGDTRNLVSHTELNSALQILVAAINATFATKVNGAGSPGTLILDISASKVNTVKVGL
jgi:hypothetical protein